MTKYNGLSRYRQRPDSDASRADLGYESQDNQPVFGLFRRAISDGWRGYNGLAGRYRL